MRQEYNGPCISSRKAGNKRQRGVERAGDKWLDKNRAVKVKEVVTGGRVAVLSRAWNGLKEDLSR